MTDSLLEDLGRVVTAVDEYWRNLKAQVVRNLPGDTLGQVLMRSLLELDVLDGPQVLRAGEAISELRERVHEFYKACVYGKKAEGLRKQPDSYKFIVERDVEWFYEGDVPFASDDYLKAHKLLPPEREGCTAPSNARVFKPVEDEGAEESDPGIDGRPRD